MNLSNHHYHNKNHSCSWFHYNYHHHHHLSRRNLGLILVLVLLSVVVVVDGSESRFDPYQLNGGLVSAVAGKDYVLLASDTRFVGPGGYDLLSRNHIESRLWMATETTTTSKPLLPPQTTTTTTTTKSDDENHTKNNDNDPEKRKKKKNASSSLQPLPTFLSSSSKPPIWIGSVGCNADCQELQRIVQADVRAATYFEESFVDSSNNGSPSSSAVDQVATVLSQILYTRRGFPYYSFCVVGGLADDGSSGGGKVFVYDAIGSYEQVSVAVSGTGRELLQPILDRKFRTATTTTTTTTDHNNPVVVVESSSSSGSNRQVDCSLEEAISALTDAYRSVSEREIGVGDKLVLCAVVRQKEEDEDDVFQCHRWVVPLKEH